MYLISDEFTRKQKMTAISRALRADPVDKITLKQLAISRGGLITDELRRKTYAALLSIDIENISPKPCKI